MSIYIKSKNIWKSVNQIYKKTNNAWSIITQSEWEQYINTAVSIYGGNIDSGNTLTIGGPASVSSETCQYISLYNNVQVTGAVWSIVSGTSYATIDSSGSITILSGAENSPITISCQYQGLTSTKEVLVTYVHGSSSETESETETIVDPDTGQTTETTTTTTTTTDEQGNVSTSTTTSEVITNQDGSSSTVETVENVATDGSSTSTSNTVNYDENGDITSSSTNTTNVATDGSSTSQTTNYNENGDPTSQVNNEIDTSGNSSTQDIIYDEEGNSTVTGYTIDTTNNPDGEKEFNGDGVNTEYYAFDLTHGFVLDFDFTIDYTQQPPGQNENHHNILTMKRATPTPWYGFQLRQSSTNKYVQLGTQFATGSNTNTTLTATTTTGNVAEYNLQIIYDPTATTNKFVCKNSITGTVLFSKNDTFPDIPELRYLKVTIGCAMDENGDPYRYSNINVQNFSIRRLTHVDDPVISCDGRHITITCSTVGATIYYRLNQIGSFSQYSGPITITSDKTVEAYAELDSEQSNTVTQNCIYDNGIEEPVITCDGQQVTITCATTGTTIYYRLGTTGNYAIYVSPIEIYEDTIVYSYAELNGEYSDTVSENCIYDSGIDDPVIDCDGEEVTIMCDTPSVDIYYRLNQTGNFILYEGAIEILADTLVEAYAELNGATSHTVSKNCIYSPIVMYNPVILCNGSMITISCATVGATIYYRLNQTGNYVVYNGPLSITEDTVVEAYAKLSGHLSQVVTETCIYDPVHDYSQDYLTLRVLTAGTIPWASIGTGQAKTIEYSINNGTWTTITAGSSTTISVSANDVVRLRGTNNTYAKDKSNYSGFEGGTATYDIEGNIMSLVYGDNFVGNNTLTGTYNFCSMFKLSNAISAEHLILPATTLTAYCYRAIFSKASSLITPPALPATTLAQGVYWYAFEECPITSAPDLLATELVRECYGYMFTGCRSLNYIKCLATSGFSTYQCLQGWVTNVASNGTFVKDVDTPIATGSWTRGNSGIPTSWLVYDNSAVASPEIVYDGFSTVTLTCSTQGATIYYRLGNTGSYSVYSTPITITEDTVIETYSELGGQVSRTISQTCLYVSNIPIEAANRNITEWKYNNQRVTTPYSVNAIDGHSSSYAKGTFNFETSIALRDAYPTHLWFQHADQSATIYVDDVQVEKHWGGYNSFSVDISNYVHTGTNNIKVALKNNEGNNLAPASGDFNFNATLGNVRLLTSPVLPDISYGYDGFHVSSTVTDAEATIYVKTLVPTGASVVCTITDNVFNYTDTKNSDGEEMTFITTITNPHLWNGTIDPHLYTITLNIYYNNVLYHTFSRDYGLRYYSYVINDTTILPNNDPYTGFLLNGSPYLLRGVCMHHDIEGKANALTSTDIANDFSLIHELGCNFIRLAHYPHPKEVYDWCDRQGIIVQTEAPCVNKLQSTMPTDYYTHLETQYREMVNEHYNHPSIIFWGLSNETTTDDKAFGKTKIEAYTTIIKSLDPSRLVGYVMSHSVNNPSSYYNNPNVDWFGCNIYVGWYIDKASNDPTSQLNTRVNNIINNLQKPLAFSEYGAGGTQHCHSEDPQNTTTKGNYERHDIEYQMWLHEGHIAAIRNFPQLLFTAQWQLFDIAVANRNEGYTICLDGETTSTDDNLRRLNNKGLVERDHTTKKDTFYIYKAEWSNEKFVHICGKDYTRKTDRVIKCYTNDGNSLSLYVNNSLVETVTVSNNIALFTSNNFNTGDIIRVTGSETNDTFTFQ